jgi:molybdopterin-containing oxidoreductase family iron-sulfur binding subunit
MNKETGGIWIGEKDLSRDESFIRQSQEEFVDASLTELVSENTEVVEDMGGSRRDFLKMMGFGLGAATVAAGCDIPVKRAIPYVVKPDEIVPGVATYYASTFVQGGDVVPVLVKTREGRPIKIEGNTLSAFTQGGTSARAQASVLSLYDVNRLKNPALDGEEASWSDLDARVKSALQAAKGIRILTHTVLSPTAKRALEEFKGAYPSTEVVTFDPVSSAAILRGNEASFGQRFIPDYHFDKAEVIVGFNCDFLGTWISPVEYARQYAKNRKIKDVRAAHMSRHIQVESQMSLTGSNADNRILVKPSEQGAAIAYLYTRISGQALNVPSINEKAKAALDKLAAELKENAGSSLVVSGSNNTSEQILVNAINHELGNYGSTIGVSSVSMQRQGDEGELAALVDDIRAGDVDVVIFHQCNPLYEYGAMEGLSESLSSVSTKIALSYDVSESSDISNIVAPVHHYLESWGDAEAKSGNLSLIQPTIHPLFDTRQAELSLLVWASSSNLNLGDDQPYLSYLKQNWEDSFFPQQSEYLSFQTFWDQSLHDGVFSYDPEVSIGEFSGDAASAMAGISQPSSSALEIQFAESITVGNGQYANNPWLQEMPDPITRCTWGNYLAVPVEFDGVRKFIGLNKLKDGQLVELTIGGETYTVPVIQQFGQMKGTVSLNLGYGRDVVGLAGKEVGVNVNRSVSFANGLAEYHSDNASLSNSKGKEEHYSSVQYHHTMGVEAPDKKTGETINADEAATVYATYGLVKQGFQGSLTERSIIRKAHVSDVEHAVEELEHEREHFEELNQETLYPFEKYSEEFYSQGHHWGMHVDLNACIGCGACTVACMAENNIPVVGKKQISRHQEMAWLRIDRYYYGDVENPNVVYQPMMCQHCDNAPCENVCPVNATNHSSEGLNQMTYNRCIGTRYCANNCPYKVRRFNWLDYTTADIFPGNQVSVNGEDLPYGADNLTRMVLNPDVTVRSRGVIEKCSFCVQRIQEGKLTAKRESRTLMDSDVRTACQTACPTGAITFGDRNNKKGELSKKFESPLNMIVLEEVNTRSSVQYTMKVNNRDESLDA